MCVTNTTQRRGQAISLAPSQVPMCNNVIPQRLYGSMMPAAAPVQGPIVAPRSQPTEEYTTCVRSFEKPRPKRRRKPQKPGLTAKNNERHFVVHNYHDHAMDPDEVDEPDETHTQDEQRRRGGVAIAFPVKLHAVLDQVEADGLGHIISWQPHGRCFVVHEPKEFVDHVMPK